MWFLWLQVKAVEELEEVSWLAVELEEDNDDPPLILDDFVDFFFPKMLHTESFSDLRCFFFFFDDDDDGDTTVEFISTVPLLLFLLFLMFWFSFPNRETMMIPAWIFVILPLHAVFSWISVRFWSSPLFLLLNRVKGLRRWLRRESPWESNHS